MDEVLAADTDLKDAEDNLKQQQEKAGKEAIEQLEQNLMTEEEILLGLIKQLGIDLDHAKKGSEEEKHLKIELEKAKTRYNEHMTSKIKKIMAEKLKQQNMKYIHSKTKEELKKLVKLIKEANDAAKTLKRNITFTTLTMKEMDAVKNIITSKIQLFVQVINKEDFYNYTWPLDKFYNRLGMIRDYVNDYLDDGVLQRYNEDNDPFWDPPAAVLIGSLKQKLNSFVLFNQDTVTIDLRPN